MFVWLGLPVDGNGVNHYEFFVFLSNFSETLVFVNCL